jgi:hypothetical protein
VKIGGPLDCGVGAFVKMEGPLDCGIGAFGQF